MKEVNHAALLAQSVAAGRIMDRERKLLLAAGAKEICPGEFLVTRQQMRQIRFTLPYGNKDLCPK